MSTDTQSFCILDFIAYEAQHDGSGNSSSCHCPHVLYFAPVKANVPSMKDRKTHLQLLSYNLYGIHPVVCVQ
jgi:hypothetical protein